MLKKKITNEKKTDSVLVNFLEKYNKIMNWWMEKMKIEK